MRDNELQKFKIILLNQKQAILDNNQEHQRSMENLRESSLGDEIDHVMINIKNTLDGSIFKHHHRELELIERALYKIENNAYGICEMCDEPIAFQRLKAKPHAKYCIVCREIVEKTQRKNNEI